MFHIVTTENCKFCKMAEDLLLKNDLLFAKDVLVTTEQKETYMRITGYATVPQIAFIPSPNSDSKEVYAYIGGYTELVAYLAAREAKEEPAALPVKPQIVAAIK